MMNKFFKKAAISEQSKLKKLVGISDSSDIMSMVCMQGSEQGNLIVLAHSFIKSADQQVKEQALKKFVESHNLQGTECCYILQLEQYRISLTDTPKVESTELSAALKWNLKDILDYPVEEAIVDAFELPQERASDNAKMAYVVAVKKSIVHSIEKQINDSGLLLAYINIEELGLRNLSMLHEDSSKGAVFLHLTSDGGNLIINQGDELYINRRMEIDLSNFVIDEDYVRKQVEELQGEEFLDKLALEIQRTMDYCSTTFLDCPINVILMAASEIDTVLVGKYLAKTLGIPVNNLDFVNYFWFENPIKKNEQSKTMLAFAAALYHLKPREKTNAES